MSLPAGLLERTVGHLRFPWLFLLTVVAFVINLVVPDPLPLVDEIVLGLVGLLLGSLREDRRRVGKGGAGTGSRGARHGRDPGQESGEGGGGGERR